MKTESVQVRLPSNHPIFNLEKGYRAAQVKRWIEIGMQIETSVNALKQEINKSTQKILAELKNIKHVEVEQSDKKDDNKPINGLANAATVNMFLSIE